MANLIHIPLEIGIYKIYALNNGLGISIQRFANTDESGLLYIGQTSRQTLRKRVYNFLLTASPHLNTKNHSGALKYRINPVIQKTLSEHKLYIVFETCENPLFRDGELISNYKAIFGECPILNK